MAYRDDRDALLDRLAALERQVQRTEQLERRVRELEQENRQLREAAEATAAPAPEPPGPTSEIYVDPKISDYVAAIVAATGSPPGRLGETPLTEYVLSGARADDTARVVQAARAAAAAAGRRYVVPQDVVSAAPGILSDRVILTDRSAADGVTGEAFIRRVLEMIEVP